jgi:uncharacterized protein (TIGR00106 family)
MAIMEISVLPVGTGQPGVGEYVAELIRYVQSQGVPYQLTDMGTLVEGDPDRLLEVARALHELPFARGVQRVLTRITLDDRRDRRVALGEKTRSVESRLT